MRAGNTEAAVARREKVWMKELKLQIRCLRYRAGVSFSKLPRLSHNGRAYSFKHVERHYFVLLQSWADDPSLTPTVRHHTVTFANITLTCTILHPVCRTARFRRS